MSTISGVSGGTGFEQLRDKLFARAGSDRSGGLSLDEFRELGQRAPGGGPAGVGGTDAAQAIFAALDADQDGSLANTERKPPPGLGGPPGGRAGSGFSAESLATLLGEQEAEDDTTAATNDVASLISAFLERYRSENPAERQGGTSLTA